MSKQIKYEQKQSQKISLDEKLGQKLKQGKLWVKKNKTLTFSLTVIGIIGAIVIPTITKINWIGFGEDADKHKAVEEEFDSKTVEKEFDLNNKLIKKVEKYNKNFQSAKTLWDWLQLGGVLAIPIALYYFERSEQRRAEKRNLLERDEAAKLQREDALESYISQISQLLIDTKLIKEINNYITHLIKDDMQARKIPYLSSPLIREDEMIENAIERIKKSSKLFPELVKRLNKDPEKSVVLDIIRARTLSILRKLDKDGDRKREVIRFLIDLELLDKLDLSGADLKGANLQGLRLEFTNLEGANLERANLSGAFLKQTNLIKTNLINTKNLMPEQVKKATNWQEAYYNIDFYIQLVCEDENALGKNNTVVSISDE